MKLTTENITLLRNDRQFLFWLREMPLNEEVNLHTYYEKLLTGCTNSFLKGAKLDILKAKLTQKQALFRSITITLLTSFKIKTSGKDLSEIYHAKACLSNIDNSWEVFVKDVLAHLEYEHGFNNIAQICTFKLGVKFKFTDIEYKGYVHGKLLDSQLNKHNKLVLFPKK